MPAKKKRSSRQKASKRVDKLEINDLETLKVITDPTRLAIIESLAEPGSVTEIAERLDVPRTRLYHHIKVLAEHGLVHVASTRKKGALSENLYEPAAHSYVPGPKLLESEDHPERVEAVIAGVLDTTREDLRRSLLRHGIEEKPGQPKEISLFRSLTRLRPEEAEQLINEITELVERYGSLHKDDEDSEDTRRFAFTWLFYPSSRRGK